MRKVAILGSSGYVTNLQNRDLAGSLAIAGANTGNFVFQHAVRRMIGDTAEVYNLSLGEDYFWRRPGKLLESVDLVVMPAANHLRIDADWTGFNSWLSGIKKPFIVMGLGAQADKNGDPEETIKSLKTNASVVKMCDLLRERSVFIGVRGEFSRQVAHGLGLTQSEVTGCPSFMLSDAVDLGMRLQNKLNRARDEPELVNFAMVAEAPYNIVRSPRKLKAEQTLFKFLRQVQGTYIQQSGGEEAILAATGQIPERLIDRITWQLSKMAPELTSEETLKYLHTKGKVFFSAPDWIEYLRNFDVCIGHRFHGNMAAIGANRLGVVVTHDSRTAELVNHMQIPFVNSSLLDDDAAPTAAHLLENINFDATAFDNRRREIASRWINIFEQHGVSLEPYVHAIASSPSYRPN